MRAPVLLISAICLTALVATGCSKPSPEARAPATNALASDIAKSEPAKPAAPQYIVSRDDAGEAAPTVELEDPDGEKMTLGRFAGKPFLVALWGPQISSSVDELPSLDELASEGKIQVVAVAPDRRSIDAVIDPTTPFLARHQFKALKDYRQPGLALIPALHGAITPSAFLYDSKGRLVLEINGAADFTSADVRALLAEAKQPGGALRVPGAY